MKHTYILVYACDFAPGSNILCGPETIARLERVIKYIKEHSNESATILLTAGYKNKRRYSIGLAMEKWLERRIVMELMDATFNRPIIYRPDKNNWSTYEETSAAAWYIKQQRNFGIEPKVVAITSDYHEYRVDLCWLFIQPSTKVLILTSSKISCWYSPLLEPIKLLKVLYKFAKMKFA